MKFLLLLVTILTSILSSAQTSNVSPNSPQSYNGLPVIKANSTKADYRVNEVWSKGSWIITPEATPDVLKIACFSTSVQFAFYTDLDSIAFPMDASKVQQFYVLTSDNKYALTEIRGFNYDVVNFESKTKGSGYQFWYEDGKNNAYLHNLRTKYNLDALTRDVKSDSAKALRILKWTHDQWNHNGNNTPKKSDAISILEEAKTEGKQFRCVEYGIVATTALNSIGLPARVLALKTKDVETTESGAGHVLLEVYLRDMKKWAVMDGQWDAMPLLNGVPLNAVEFQHAIAKNYDGIELRSLSGADKHNYIKWIFPYLYYFDVNFDNRQGFDLQKELQGGKPSLMLVPANAAEPKIFQKKWPINNVVYTRSVEEFYTPPFNKEK